MKIQSQKDITFIITPSWKYALKHEINSVDTVMSMTSCVNYLKGKSKQYQTKSGHKLDFIDSRGDVEVLVQ